MNYLDRNILRIATFELLCCDDIPTKVCINEALDLRRPIYRATSYHGHFGREDAGFPWERTDKAEAIRADL